MRQEAFLYSSQQFQLLDFTARSLSRGRLPCDRLVREPFTLDMIGTSLGWTLPDHEVKLVRWPDL